MGSLTLMVAILSSRTRLVVYIYKSIAITLGVLLFLNGCEIKSAELKTLESSVSIIQLTTGWEVSRWYQDKGGGFTGPRYAEIRIEYKPTNDYTKEEVYNQIVDILKSNNWEGEECIACSSASFSASLQQDDYPIPINARVRIHSDENLVSIRMVNPKP
jgi:hypothetical protein